MPKILTAPAMSRCIGCYSCMLACARLNYASYSPRHAALQIRTQGGLQGRLVADICRACREPACAEACPTGALAPRAGGGVRLDEQECIGCRACVSACPLQVIYWPEGSRTPIVCKQCGICVRYCPHDCLAMTPVGAIREPPMEAADAGTVGAVREPPMEVTDAGTVGAVREPPTSAGEEVAHVE